MDEEARKPFFMVVHRDRNGRRCLTRRPDPELGKTDVVCFSKFGESSLLTPSADHTII